MRIHVKTRSFRWNARSCFVELENRECMKVVMDNIAKLFPAYLMNPANRETFTLETFVVYGILLNWCTCWLKRHPWQYGLTTTLIFGPGIDSQPPFTLIDQKVLKKLGLHMFSFHTSITLKLKDKRCLEYSCIMETHSVFENELIKQFF